ncbi:AsmA family protein [Anderseniella sp. Alg231-50]|uniref:AsmA family protein n=1 Tax=Anderseniella sp. Alg231-50 TaxID=1922226 RepID=UPI000D55A5C9
MNIVRSPLLILGILIILVAGALGVGPLLVNWNSYKADFQRQTSLLIGRQVSIDGPVTVRLFPWPRLTAANVRVANPPGSMLTDMLQIEKVDAEIAAAPLLSGQFSLRKLTLVRPVASFERLAAGGVSWQLRPTHSIVGLPGADQVAVAGIDIIDGRIFFGDGRRGGLSEMTSVQGRLKAPALDGPWRADITATQAGSPLALTISTSKYRRGKPLKVSAAISPRGDAGFMWAFDGETLRDDGKVTGRITVQPARQPNGKANPLNANLQVRVSGDVTADFDMVKLDNIEVVPANDLTGRNLMTGEASVKLGSSFIVTTKLEAAAINLDQLVGNNVFAELGSGDQLYAVSNLLEALPSNTQILFDAGITSLITGGETLSKARLSGDISPKAMRIKEASASLPGQTRARFAGVILPVDNEGLPQLAGELEVQSRSLREFVMWVAPDMADATKQVWSGARGRAKLRTLLGWTPVALRLTGTKASLDDASATGSFSLYQGDNPSLSIRLLADSINVDRYAPRGFSTSAIEEGTVAGLTDLAANALAFGDAHITIQTDSLVLRGVEAQDIAIDVDMSEGAVELRTIEIGGIGDARLDIAGVLNFPEEGITGSVSGDFKATDPRPFLRLIGMMDADLAATPWARRLGPVDLRVLSEVSTGSTVNKFTVAANGKAAGAEIALTGGFDGKFANWREGDTQITGSATGTTSAGLLALAGLNPLAGGNEPAKLKMAFAGKPSSALTGTSELSLLSSTVGFEGGITVSPKGGISAAGAINLKADDISPLASAVGLAVPAWPVEIDRRFAAKADAVISPGNVKLSNLNATMPLNTIAGEATVTGTIKAPLIDGKLTVQTLDLGWLASSMVMPADGKPVRSASTFDATRLAWLNRSLTIAAQRVALLPGLALSSARTDIKRANKEAVNFSITGNASSERRFTMFLAAQSAGPLLKLSGKLDATLALTDLLQTVDGQGAINGNIGLQLDFNGEGRSPGGLVSQLTGTGRAVPTSLTLPRFNLPGVTRRLAAIEDVNTIDEAINSALSQGAVNVNAEPADVSLQNGSLRTASIPLSNEFAGGTMRLSADFSTQSARADVSLKPNSGNDEVPGIAMRLRGHPQSLSRTYDTSALKSWVVVSVLQKGMERLEELQREELRLIEEERKYREEQAAREAERERKLREARETAARRARQEEERVNADEGTDSRATTIEQQRLQDLIEKSIPLEIPDAAIIEPQNSGLLSIQPAQPSNPN